MSLIVSEVYDALVEAGATVEKARSAAAAIPAADRFVTREEFSEQTGKLKQGQSELVLDMQQSRQDATDLRRLFDGIKEDLETMKQDFVEMRQSIHRMDKRVAVLNLAVFTFGPVILGLLVKLVFFP